MVDLLLVMLERLGMIVTIAFVLTRLRFFQEMVDGDRLTNPQQYVAIVFFGVMGIIGTYSGVTFNTDTLLFERGAPLQLESGEAIANSRVIGVVIAGLLGGYKVGVGAGLIAGIHRLALGGFTGLACGIASVVTGLIAGRYHSRSRHPSLQAALLIGALSEAVQMLIILGIARPFQQAWELVEMIGVPMIVANGIGSALFLLIINNVVNEKEKVGALQAQKTLRIANQTLSHLRKGLTRYSAHETCEILYREVQASAVGMTNRTKILAHVGAAADHHKADHPIQTSMTKDVILKGKLIVASETQIDCAEKDCPLNAAVVAPLKRRGETIGTLKFYFRSKKEITPVIIELIQGLSTLLSSQLEISEADRAHQLAKEAEIKALQAQISPHFLFNSLNVIVSLIRLDPKKARKLLLSLSQFFRQNLEGTTSETTTLRKELEHVKAYLTIEEARFVDRLSVQYEIDEQLLNQRIPPLTLQPLVENSMKHGFKNKREDCLVRILVKEAGDSIAIQVEDNGEGIKEERLLEIGYMQVESEGTGLGLYNVNRRLTMMYDESAALQIDSEWKRGTTLAFHIPKGETI